MRLFFFFWRKQPASSVLRPDRQEGTLLIKTPFMRWMAPKAATTEPNSVLVDLRGQRSDTTAVKNLSLGSPGTGRLLVS